VTIRVLLVDDQDLVRAGFAMVLGSQPDLAVVGEAADGAAAVRLARKVPADVMVMDVRMPGMDGVAATREICQAAERPRVLILTTFDLDEYAFAALRAGASGFLLKSAPPEELLYAIRSVHQGDSVVAPSTTRRLIGRFLPHLPTTDGAPDRDGLAELTAREREVLAQVGSGLSNTEIAALLHISEATVKTHVGHIMAKLGLRDRIQAVVYAYETGLIAPQGRRLRRSRMVTATATAASAGTAPQVAIPTRAAKWFVSSPMIGAPIGVPPMKTSMYSPMTRPRSAGSVASWTDAFAMAWNMRLTKPRPASSARNTARSGAIAAAVSRSPNAAAASTMTRGLG
jgi:DNA-binding NarL/FixJ family response regulator